MLDLLFVSPNFYTILLVKIIQILYYGRVHDPHSLMSIKESECFKGSRDRKGTEISVGFNFVTSVSVIYYFYLILYEFL